MLLSILLSVFLFASSNEPQTVAFVDVNRYIGTWYEIARIPASFQKKCVSNTTAEYSANEDGTISVINSCEQKDGTRNIANGNARIEDETTNAKLTVTFVKIFGNWIYSFGGDYWIIGLDEDYQLAVIGHPTRDYGWILSRTPNVDPKTLKMLRQILVNNGYDTCKLLTTIQKDGFDKELPLCEIL